MLPLAPICAKISAKRGVIVSTACRSVSAPSLRRTSGSFWGWWLVLEQDDHHFRYHYQLGFYNADGEWLDKPIPKKHQVEVERTLNRFYKLISDKLTALECQLAPADQVTNELTVTAA